MLINKKITSKIELLFFESNLDVSLKLAEYVLHSSSVNV